MTAARDGSLAIWNVATGLLERRIDGHKDIISSVAFSPDGRLIVSTSFDGTAKLWDAATGELRSTLRTYGQLLTDAVFSADGASVAVLALDGSIRQYLIRVEDLRALAETLISREFTPQERARYLGEAPATSTATP